MKTSIVMSWLLGGFLVGHAVARELYVQVPPPEQADIAGSYSCFGEQAGKPYRLELIITNREATYDLSWGPSVFAAKSSPTMLGLGVRDGERLAAVILSVATGGVGVVVYRISAGELRGRWTDGGGEVLTENCTVGRPV